MRPSSIKAFAHPVLLADIGGTNARFAVVDEPSAPFRDLGRTPTATHADPLAAIENFVLPHLESPPRSAILAVAAAVEGEEIRFTNSPWVLVPEALRRRFDLETVVVINDFEAQALALPHLAAADLAPIGGGTARPDATMAVVGPGTGLGVAMLVRARGVWIPVPGEGGHVDFAPRDDREAAIVREVARAVVTERDETGRVRESNRISAEDVLAGRGISRVHRAILALDGRPAEPLSPEAVSTAAKAGDPAAREAFAFFARALGRVCGDVALTAIPHGGLFVAGGIPPKNIEFLLDGGFRAAFEDKWPYREKIMEKIATTVVVHEAPAFVGLSAFARDPDGHAVALDGRLWRG